MNLYSTSNRRTVVSLREAILQPLSPDGGLWIPDALPRLTSRQMEAFRTMSFPEISFQLSELLLHEDVPQNMLEDIVQEAFDFDVPLVPVTEHVGVLELFHGPTLAFKDFGARFMARLLSYLYREQNEQLTILVATSGDTGSAVAQGFFQVDSVRVVLLYPHQRISEIQEKQMTTLGNNITAIEVHGTFDDCQRLVKTAFSDPDLRERMELTSANSINIARLIPQSFYYFGAWARQSGTLPIVVSVPSGNMGNLTAGLIAKRMGLPVAKFVVATNINDVVPAYLRNGIFEPRESIKTMSNAMDVGNPSNLTRILALYDHDLERLRQDLYGTVSTDEETTAAMKELWNDHHYLCDPHGAVGYLGLMEYLNRRSHDRIGIFLATAHPAKFTEIVEQATGADVPIPPSLQECMSRPKQSVAMQNSYPELKAFLLSLSE